MGRERGHAHAGTHVHGVIVQHDRLVERAAHAFGHLAGGIGIGIAQADRELIAAEPGDQVAVAAVCAGQAAGR